jgi:glutathione S-transferase
MSAPPPPAPPALTHLTLVSIPFSHFNVYAAWALERAGLRVARLVRVLPLLHLPVMPAFYWWHGAAPRAADRTSSPLGTPVLFAHGGAGAGGAARALRSSGEIVAFADSGGAVFGGRARAPPLSPAEAAAEHELVAACEERLGPAARTWAYSFVLYDARAFLSLARSAGPLTGLCWLLLSPLLMLGLRSALRVWGQEARRRASEACLREEFARASARLAVPLEGGGARRFFFGDSFGPADLAFAALGFYAIGLSAQDVASGVLRGVAFSPSLEAFPAAHRDFALEMRATPAGQHILRMVSEERGRRGSSSS